MGPNIEIDDEHPMKHKHKSNYRFTEAMQKEKDEIEFNQQLKPETFLKNEARTNNHETDKLPLCPNKFNTATPFLDNFDAEFQEPDFKNKKYESDPFGQFKPTNSNLSTPFDAFNTQPPSKNTEPTNMLEHVLAQGFLSAKEPAVKTLKTPFD